MKLEIQRTKDQKRKYIKYRCDGSKKVKTQIIIIGNIKEELMSQYMELERKKNIIVGDDEHMHGIEGIVKKQCQIKLELEEYNMIANSILEKIKQKIYK